MYVTKLQDFGGKSDFVALPMILSFNPWAILATCLHLRAPQKTQEN
jgi:hypothetical protein